MDPIVEWDTWADIAPPGPLDVDPEPSELPIITDPDGNSVPYPAHRFGLADAPTTVHPWPTATVTW